MIRRRPGVQKIYKLESRGTWRLVWVDHQGKKHEPSFPRKIDAERKAEEIRHAMRRSGGFYDPQAGEVSFQEVWDRYLLGKSGTVKMKTYLGYKSLGDSLILPHFAEQRVNSILPSDIKAWLAGIREGEEGVSSSRARQALISLSGALDSALDDHLIPMNPAARVTKPRSGAKREGKSLTLEQLYAVAAETPTQMDRALLLTLGLVGLRWGEATGLQVESVDFDRLTMRIKRTYSAYGGGVHEDVPKNHQARTVPFPKSLASELMPLVENKRPNEDVFTGPRGGAQRSSNWIRRVYRPALESAEVVDVSGQKKPMFNDVGDRIIHDLRHTFASVAIQAGANVKVLQRAMGHADASETLNTYADLFDDDLGGLGAAIEARVYTMSTVQLSE